VSKDAAKRFCDKLKGMGTRRMVVVNIKTVARTLNPVIEGRINYFGRFYPSEMTYTMWCVNRMLIRWVMNKFKRLRRRFSAAYKWL
jgi:hypothetical protein